jgi:hypothetical protein
MRHAENPSPRIPNGLAFAQRDIQAKKDFLRGLLSVSRSESESDEVPVHVLAGFLENMGDLLLERRHSRIEASAPPVNSNALGGAA